MDVDFEQLARQCAPWVHAETLSGIVAQETGFKTLLININRDKEKRKGYQLERQPRNKAEAIATAENLIRQGFNIDVGIGQINSDNLPKYGFTVARAFDACENLALAGSIFYWNYEEALKKYKGDEHSAALAALSKYNTGSFVNGFSNGYVQKVINNIAKNKNKPPRIVKLLP